MHRLENVKNYRYMTRLSCYTSVRAVYFHDTCGWGHCNQFSYKFVSIRDSYSNWCWAKLVHLLHRFRPC